MNTATEYFDYLIENSTSLIFNRNLERIKRACDDLIDMGEKLSNRKIGKYTKKHYGAPTYSGIRDSQDHKAYINLRKKEQEEAEAEITLDAGAPSAPNLPRDIPQLHQYIRVLESEIETLKEMMAEQDNMLQHNSATNPIKLDYSIAAGPQQDASMQMVWENDSNSNGQSISTTAKEAIKKLLELGSDSESYLQYDKTKNGERLMLITESFEKCILTSKKLRALREVLQPDSQ